MSLSAPAQLTLPFASSGVKNTIPNPSQIATDPGLASYTDGFPPATRAPVASGGKPPYGEDMNGVLYQTTLALQWEQAGGRYPYASAFATAVGGYPLSAIVQSSDGSGSWLNTAANNTADPENAAAPNGWQPVAQRGITSVALAGTNVTLTNLQSAKETIVFTGTLTANVVVTVSPFIKDYKFVNLTSGAFTVSVKTPTGAAIPVNQGARLDVYGDGTTLNAPGSSAPSGVVGGMRNLVMSVTAASASATITADEVIVEVTLGGTAYKLANFNNIINLATTGAGGMDTGSAPVSGYVALYAIYNPATQARALLAVNTTASNAPSVYGGSNMPAGYTASALVGVWPTNASNQFPVGVQQDRVFKYGALIQIINTSTQQASLTALNINSAVPANAITCSGVAVIQSSAAASLQTAVAGGSLGQGQQNIAGGALTVLNGYFNNVPILANSRSIYFLANVNTGTMAFTLSIGGYTI